MPYYLLEGLLALACFGFLVGFAGLSNENKKVNWYFVWLFIFLFGVLFWTTVVTLVIAPGEQAPDGATLIGFVLAALGFISFIAGAHAMWRHNDEPHNT